MVRVMIVDDEWFVREGLIHTIPWNEFQCTVVSEALNGEEALDKLKETEVDILLTDIRMPLMDGLELADKVAESFPNISVVFLTGFDEFAYAQRAVQVGAMDYILKPTNPEELKEVFERVIRKREKQQEVTREDDNRELDAKLDSGYGHSQMITYIQENCGNEMTLQELADHMHVSESYASRIFKKRIGKSFVEYVTELRMERAKVLLQHPHMKIYEISLKVGYHDQRYFSQQFRKYMGETPSEYRQHFVKGPL